MSAGDRELLPGSQSSVQLHRIPELHGTFRTAGRTAGIGVVRRRCRCQMLRIGRPVPLLPVRSEVRTLRRGSPSLQEPVRR